MSPSNLQATTQVRDEIRIGDVVFPLCAPPLLNPHFAQNPERDLGIASIDVLENYDSCSTYSEGDLIEIWTSLHRGYVATFAIEDGQLLVEQIWTPIFATEAYLPVIDCAMPEPESRYLSWYTGPLYYVLIDPVESEEGDNKKYSLYRVDIEKGQQVASRILRSETHGSSSWLRCSSDWSNDTNEGPITLSRCHDFADHVECANEKIE